MAFAFIYLVAMVDMSYYHASDYGYADILITSYQRTDVKVYGPWEDVGEYHIINDTRLLSFPFSSHQLPAAQSKGFKIESSQAITVQVSIGKKVNTMEMAYLALPLTVSSTEYYLASYTNRGTAYKQFYMVITDSQPADVTVYRYQEGERVIVTSFHLDSRSTKFVVMTNTSLDITGYQLVSTAPVVALAGHQCANIPINALYCDPLIQQLLPVADLGQNHVLGPIRGRAMETGYTIRVVKVTADTDVVIEHAERRDVMETIYHGAGNCSGIKVAESTTAVYRRNCMGQPSAGDFIEVRNNAASLPVVVSCSAACMVLQYNHGGRMDRTKSDPFMMIVLPFPAETMVTRFTTFKLHSKNNLLEHTNYVNILAKLEDYPSLLLDGQPLSTTDSTVLRPEFGQIRSKSFPISPGRHMVSHLNNSARVSFSVQLYGHGGPGSFTGKSSFGMPIGRGLWRNQPVTPSTTTIPTTPIPTTTSTITTTTTTLPPTTPTTTTTTTLPPTTTTTTTLPPKKKKVPTATLR